MADWHPGIDRAIAPKQRPKTWFRVGLVIVALLGVAVRALGIGRYPGLIYDEFYYVPAADVLLRRHPLAAVKNMVPGIDPNLLSHPPLTKEMIAAAIYTLGQHPWAWRLPALLFGAAVPLIVAGIVIELFQDRAIAIGAGALAALDGLVVVMSRVALPDSPAVALVLASLWALTVITGRLRRGEEVSGWRWTGLGVLLGLALASEWIGGQAILMAWIWLLVSHPKVRRLYRRWIPATTILPLAVYYLTYFYAWPSGYHEPWLPSNPYIAFFKLQWLMLKDMWTLRFFHPWTANAWTWLLIPRPTAMILSVSLHQTVRLMAFSDPLVVWIGLAALLGGILYGKRHPAYRQAWGFLGLWFLCFYATWLLTPRSKFLYYFASASVGLDIACAAALVILWRSLRQNPVGRALWGGLVGLVSLTLLYLLPLWVGMALPRPFYHAIFWPASWNARTKPSTTVSTANFALTMNPVRTPVSSWKSMAAPTGAPPLPKIWPVFRGSPSHNSNYSTSWRVKSGYALTLATAGLAQAPAVVGTTAYVGTNNSQLYAVNVPTGTVKWAVGLPNTALSTPVVQNGMVVVGLGNGVFSHFSKHTGWIRGNGVSGLMAFNQKTGADLWFHPTQGEVMSSPVIANKTVYAATGASRLVALSLTTGKRLWSLKLGGFDSLSSPIIADHHLYVATNAYFSAYPAKRSTVWSINVITHQVSWHKNLPVASGLSDCSLASDGTRLYVAGVPKVSNRGQGTRVSQKLFSLNQASGNIVWARSMGRGHLPALDQTEEGIPLVVGGVVYEGSPASNRVVAFKAASGQRLWTRRLAAGVTGNPVLAGGRLWVITETGRLIVLNAQTGRIVASDPYAFGTVGAASPLIVGDAVLQSTLSGKLVVQPLEH